MSAPRIIAIVVFVVLGAHLLLFGWLRRMINHAKAEAERRDRNGDEPAAGPAGNAEPDQNGRL